jgi:hypothetical protein
MNRKLVLLVSSLTAALLLTSCGQSIQDGGLGGGSDSSISTEQVDKGISVAQDATYAPTQSIIRTGDLTLKTSDVQEVFEEVKDLISNFNGRVESSSLVAANNDYGPSAYLTARIPETKLDETIAAISELGDRQSLNIYTSDVTLQTIDLTAKIEALTSSRDRLLELLEQATSTADLIAAEQALAMRQSELDSYQNQLDYLKSQVSESTLSIQIIDDASSVTSGLRGIKETLLQAAQNFLQAFENVVIFIGTAIPWLLVFGLLYFVLRKGAKLVARRTRK